jgi:hypothetical protein
LAEAVEKKSACGGQILRYLKDMMIPETNSERFAEFTLPDGCLLCGGEVTIRATPAGANSYCPQCHFLSKPKMKMKGDGLELSYSATANA